VPARICSSAVSSVLPALRAQPAPADEDAQVVRPDQRVALDAGHVGAVGVHAVGRVGLVRGQVLGQEVVVGFAGGSGGKRKSVSSPRLGS